MVIGLIGHSWGHLDSSNHVYPHLAIYIVNNLLVVIRRFILWRVSDEKSFSVCQEMLPLFRAVLKFCSTNRLFMSFFPSLFDNTTYDEPPSQIPDTTTWQTPYTCLPRDIRPPLLSHSNNNILMMMMMTRHHNRHHKNRTMTGSGSYSTIATAVTIPYFRPCVKLDLTILQRQNINNRHATCCWCSIWR